MFFEQILTPGLGCFSYLIGCPLAGVMAVVDPKRDVQEYSELSKRNGMRITRIFDTHVHADHVSGARELSRATGAPICIHESAPVSYDVCALRHDDVFTFGSARMRVLHTPGHTPNSISLLVTDTARSPEPQMLLTGDLLFVGATGRPDLPGEEILDEQIKSLFDSLHGTLGDLPDGLEVYPAHGQGSLCGSGIGAKPHSTLGYERVANQRMQLADFGAFAESILTHLPMRPQSFAHIIEMNLKGAPLLPLCEEKRPALTPETIVALRDQGALLLDLRDSLAFAGAHIPGSLHVDATRDQAPNWVGIVVPPKARIILILRQDADFESQRTILRRIGYDAVEGWLEGGITAWIAQGLPVQGMSVFSAKSLKDRLASANPPSIVDVRTAREFAEYSIPGSRHLPFEALLAGGGCPGGDAAECIVVCQTGYRSAIAAAILQARGADRAGFLAGGLSALRKI